MLHLERGAAQALRRDGGTGRRLLRVTLLQSAARTVRGEARLRAAGLPAGAARATLEPPPLPTVAISAGEGEGGTGLAYAVGLAIAVPGGAIAVPSSTFETVVLVIVRAARIYDRSVPRFGTPMKLRDAAKLAVRRD